MSTNSNPTPETPEVTPSQYTLGFGAVVLYQPQVLHPLGMVIKCPHKEWGHRTEDAASKCLSTLCAQFGITLSDTPSQDVTLTVPAA